MLDGVICTKTSPRRFKCVFNKIAQTEDSGHGGSRCSGRFPLRASDPSRTRGAFNMTTSDGSLVFYVVILLSLGFLTCIAWNALRPHNHRSSRSVAILVLGDIGRSPRMMYHAQSFADTGFVTHLIGYGGRLLYHYHLLFCTFSSSNRLKTYRRSRTVIQNATVLHP